MPLRHLPYLVGAFMLVPLVLWIVLESFVFAGSRSGFDTPLAVGLSFVSLPLVAWFFVSNLGMLSESMAGRDEFARPRGWGLSRVIPALPWIALTLGAASVPVLLALGEPPLLVPAPLALSVVIAVVIHLGERARRHDRGRGVPPVSVPRNGWPSGARLGDLARRVAFGIPVVGWMVRDAVRGGESEQVFFAINLLLISVIALWLFGVGALVVIGLVGTVAAFGFIIALTVD